MCEQPGQNRRPHARLPSIFLGMDAWITLTTEGSFESQATWVFDVLFLYVWHNIHGCFYNQARADVRSSGAGIKCPYCRLVMALPINRRFRQRFELLAAWAVNIGKQMFLILVAIHSTTWQNRRPKEVNLGSMHWRRWIGKRRKTERCLETWQRRLDMMSTVWGREQTQIITYVNC